MINRSHRQLNSLFTRYRMMNTRTFS